MTEYDEENVAHILGGNGDWFTAVLFRLIAKADSENTMKLWHAYTNEVNVVHRHKFGKPYGNRMHSIDAALERDAALELDDDDLVRLQGVVEQELLERRDEDREEESCPATKRPKTLIEVLLPEGKEES